MGQPFGPRPIQVDYQFERHGLGEAEPRRLPTALRVVVMLAFGSAFLAGLTATSERVRYVPRQIPGVSIRALQLSVGPREPLPIAMSGRQAIALTRTR